MPVVMPGAVPRVCWLAVPHGAVEFRPGQISAGHLRWPLCSTSVLIKRRGYAAIERIVQGAGARPPGTGASTVKTDVRCRGFPTAVREYLVCENRLEVEQLRRQ